MKKRILTLIFIFLISPVIVSADDSGVIDITDPVYILQYLFLAGPILPPPYPEKDFDRTRDQLACIEISV